MTQQRHVIKQQILELNVSSDANAFELQNQISALYRNQVVPIIEAICNQLSDPNTIHRIDRLELDLGEIEAASLETDFAQKVAEALSNQLSQILTTSTVESTAPTAPPMPAEGLHQITRKEPSLPHTETESAPISPAQAHLQSLSQTTRKKSDPSHTQTKTAPISPIEARFELFQSFIQTGHLPWWSKPLNRNDLEECFYQLLAEYPDNLKALLQNSLKQEKMMQRIVYQFSEPMRMEILKLLVPKLQPVFQTYLDDLQRLFSHVKFVQKAGSQSVRQTIWQGLFLYLSLHPSSSLLTTKSEINAVLRANLLHIATQYNVNMRSLIQQLLTTIKTLESVGSHFTSELPQVLTTLASTSNTQASSSEMFLTDEADQANTEISPLAQRDAEAISTNENSSESEDLYIQNAGVILLWPFLTRFFEVLSLVESGQFLTLQATHRATLLLQYLVDASLESLESALPLNKILCGLDLSEPVPTSLTITEDEQRECEGLLSAVIEHWSALGNTSIAGLRQTFLQRPGVLRSHREGWLLQVEQQAYDVLLDRLPWGIQVIKLPWMAQILHTEW